MVPIVEILKRKIFPRFHIDTCTKDFIFLKRFNSDEIQKIEVNSSVVGLFEFRFENSFLIIHVSNTISYVFLSTCSDTNLMSTFCNSKFKQAGENTAIHTVLIPEATMVPL